MSKIKEYINNNKEYENYLQSTGSVEYKILNHLKDVDNGFFIEAGAFDGIFQSNTKILEECGWNGLLIEPSREKAIECYHNRSKNSLVANCALVSFEFSESEIIGNFGHPTSRVGSGDKIVKAKTLTSILDEVNVTYVDFFSLDTEGYEMEVLKGIDFDRIKFGYLLIEINSTHYTLDQMDEFLIDKGYKNIMNISNFEKNINIGWSGTHQDYLYKNINLI